MLRDVVAERGEDGVLIALADEVVVDFVGDNRDAVLQADGRHFLELVARVDAAGRVVRVAEQEELDIF